MVTKGSGQPQFLQDIPPIIHQLSLDGVNFMLISMAPRQFRRFGRVSLVSGILNSCTYIGSALSTYGIALLSESMGWRITALLRAGIAGAGAVICLAISKTWSRFRSNDK